MDPTRQTRLTTAGAYYEAHNAGRISAVLDCYAPDACHEEIAFGHVRQGQEALRAGLERFFALFAGLRFSPGRLIVAGDSILSEYRMTGTVTRDLGPLKLAGRAIELSGTHVLEFAGSQIRRSRDYWDPEDLAAQAGSGRATGNRPQQEKE